MKLLMAPFMMLASLTVGGLAHADADDTQWIAECMLDNRFEGVSTSVVQKYCACMNDQMSSNETRSITQWEKTHPQEERACSARAGWR